MSQHIPHVALLIETSRTFGRGVLRGITEYAHSYGPWLFRVQERMSDSGLPDWLPGWKGDGVIARIQDRRIAGQLQRLVAALPEAQANHDAEEADKCGKVE